MATEQRARKITPGLVGLSSAAIIAVYAAGYVHTQPSEAAAIATPTQAAQQSLASNPPLVTATSTAAPGKSTTGQYKDGTYSGSGNSRHGGISVSVVIQGGKIVSADITRCGTRYPCDYISDLPGEVVSNQRVITHYISGATDSSRAYIQAVKAALAKAV